MPTTTPVVEPGTHHTDWQPPGDSPCRQLAKHEGPQVAAQVFAPERHDPFTSEPVAGYDGGRRARALCAGCPAWAECTTVKIGRNDKLVIMGGVGGARHRALRRAWGTDLWEPALAAHGRALHGEPPEPGDRQLLAAHGAGAECGKRSSFAKGHRCDACSLAAGLEGALAGAGRGRSLTAGLAAWAGKAAA